jgi:predicted ATPase
MRLAADLADEGGRLTARPARPPRLPAQTTPLLGRVGELTQMAQRLADRNCRLLTVIGPGGSGKTRLSLQAAANYGARTGLQVYFVPLATAPHPEMLVSAIGDALGLALYEHADSGSELVDALRDQALLLLLDNFEHMLPAAGLLGDVLAQAPGVKVLVTSRERLHLHGEWVMELGGLPYPPSPDFPNSDFYDAVQLFVHSARRARADFALDDASRPAVVEICRLVDGMPLGLELAAPWVRMLSAQEIANEITRNLDFLATTRRDVPARHRSLRAAFEHSWQSLDDAERAVLKRLTVFRGGFLRGAAEAVGGASLPVLAALADKSLLRVLPPRHGQGQYELHDLVRQFALDKLQADPDEAEAVGAAHCHHYLGLVSARLDYFPCTDDMDELLAEVAAEIENVRTAWAWAVSHADVEWLEAAHHWLFKFYHRQNWQQEGHDIFGAAARRLEALAAEPGGERYAALLALMLVHKSTFAAYLGPHNAARQLLERGLALLRQHGTPAQLAEALMRGGWLAREMGESDVARRMLEECAAIAQESAESAGMVVPALSHLGYFMGEMGDYEDGISLLEGLQARVRASGSAKELASVLNNLGFVYYMAGDYAPATRLLQEALALRREANSPHGVAVALTNLGYVATGLGDTTTAEAYFIEALRLARQFRAASLANDIIAGLAMGLPLPDQADRAAELITFVLQQPMTWRETRERAERWLAEHGPALAPGLAAAEARAHARTQEELVETLLPV